MRKRPDRPDEDTKMLRENINNDVKDAMRARNERKLSPLRMVNSTIKNADIAARGEGEPALSDDDVLESSDELESVYELSSVNPAGWVASYSHLPVSVSQ